MIHNITKAERHKRTFSFFQYFFVSGEPFLFFYHLYICETGFILKQGGDDMEHFEQLLEENRGAVERFVKYRIPSADDAEDLLQEIYQLAFRKFWQLRDSNAFRPWLLSIARNSCHLYFRQKAAQMEIPFDLLPIDRLSYSRYGIVESTAVSDTLELLGDKDKQMLYLYFWKELPQAEIAQRLNIPLGTVKSRLYAAKQRFKNKYPYPYHTPPLKGENNMKRLPEILPEYKITPSDAAPFTARWEEIMGWFIVPRLAEKLTWGIYDYPERKLTGACHMEVVGRAMVHGIEGVEIIAKDPMICCGTAGSQPVTRHFVAQLTDTHCRILAECHEENGIKHYYTFLDGDEFLPNWGFGENNCGNEVNLSPKGDIIRSGSSIIAKEKAFLLDIVGRYTVTIGGKSYDTVCVMDCHTYENGVLTEQFLDKNGKTILWRRFNCDDWNFSRYQKRWSDILPENEQLTVNGQRYVHWYDCITDYIL